MTKTTIALYIALIFLAGAVAGGGIARAWKPTHNNTPPPSGPRRGEPMNREDFQARIFNGMTNRLKLTPEEAEKIAPVFKKGFEEVRAIQDRSVKEVEATVKRNHEEIAKLLAPEQRQTLEEMDKEREKRHHHRGPGQSGPGGPPNGGPGPFPAPNDRPEKKENAP